MTSSIVNKLNIFTLYVGSKQEYKNGIESKQSWKIFDY